MVEIIGEKSSKFYAWERDIVFPFVAVTSPKALRLVTYPEGQSLINNIFKDHQSGPPTLGNIRSASPLFDLVDWKILIPKKHLRPIIILHESARLLMMGRPEADFVSEYITLLDRYLFIKKEALELMLPGYGL